MPDAIAETVSEPVITPTGGEAAAQDLSPAAEDPIQIGDRTFATQAEALAFARESLRESEHQRAIVEAYNTGLTERGVQSVQPAAPAAPADDPKWEERFYSNPKATLKEFADTIRKEVRTEVLSTVNTQSEEQKLWSEFFTRHPDLEGFQEDATTILNRYDKEVRALVSTKGKEQGMDFLAQKTRAKFEEYNERRKPTRALPNGGAGTVPSTQTNVTNKNAPKEEKPLSFVEQIRQNRAKRMR